MYSFRKPFKKIMPSGRKEKSKNAKPNCLLCEWVQFNDWNKIRNLPTCKIAVGLGLIEELFRGTESSREGNGTPDVPVSK